MKKGIFATMGVALLMASGAANATRPCTVDGRAVHCDVGEILEFANSGVDDGVGVVRGNTIDQGAVFVLQGNAGSDLDLSGVVSGNIDQTNLVNQGIIEVGSLALGEDRKVVNNDVNQGAAFIAQGNIMHDAGIDGVNFAGKHEIAQVNLVNSAGIDIKTDGNVKRNDISQGAGFIAQGNLVGNVGISGPGLTGHIGQTNGVNVGSISVIGGTR